MIIIKYKNAEKHCPRFKYAEGKILNVLKLICFSEIGARCCYIKLIRILPMVPNFKLWLENVFYFIFNFPKVMEIGQKIIKIDTP